MIKNSQWLHHFHCGTLQQYICLFFTSQMVTKPMSFSLHNDFTSSSSYRHSDTHLTMLFISDVLSQGRYKKGVHMQRKQHKQTPDSKSFHQNHFQLTTVAQVELGE